MKLSRFYLYATAAFISTNELYATDQPLEDNASVPVVTAELQAEMSAFEHLRKATVETSKPSWYKTLCYFIEQNGDTTPTADDYKRLATQISVFTSSEDYMAILSTLAWAERLQELMTENGKNTSILELMFMTESSLKTQVAEELVSARQKIWDAAAQKERAVLQETYGKRIKMLASDDAPTTRDHLYNRMALNGLPNALSRIVEALSQDFLTEDSTNELLDEQYLESPEQVKTTLENLGLAYMVMNTASENGDHLNIAALMRKDANELQEMLNTQVAKRQTSILKDLEEKSSALVRKMLDKKITDITVDAGHEGTLAVPIDTTELSSALVDVTLPASASESKSDDAEEDKKPRKGLLKVLQKFSSKKHK